MVSCRLFSSFAAVFAWLQSLFQARRQGVLDLIADVIFSEVNIPDSLCEGDILDESFAAGHNAFKADTGDMRQPDPVAAFKVLVFHEVEQGLTLIDEFRFWIVKAYALEEGLSHNLTVDIAFHDQVHLLGAVLGDKFGGGMHFDALLNIAADCIDLEDGLLSHGDSGERQFDLLVSNFALNIDWVPGAAAADIAIRGAYRTDSEHQQKQGVQTEDSYEEFTHCVLYHIKDKLKLKS